MMTQDKKDPHTNLSGSVFAIVGASGSGKSTLTEMFLARHPEYWQSISWTTRQPRDGELDGTHFHFVDEDAFDEGIRQDMFLEHAGVHGKQYGTPRAPIIDSLMKGSSPLLVVDINGLRQLKSARQESSHLPVVSIFIAPPSMEELKKRLLKRGSANNLELRLSNAAGEIEAGKAECEYCILNDDLERAYGEFEALILSCSRGL